MVAADTFNSNTRVTQAQVQPGLQSKLQDTQGYKEILSRKKKAMFYAFINPIQDSGSSEGYSLNPQITYKFRAGMGACL